MNEIGVRRGVGAEQGRPRREGRKHGNCSVNMNMNMNICLCAYLSSLNMNMNMNICFCAYVSTCTWAGCVCLHILRVCPRGMTKCMDVYIMWACGSLTMAYHPCPFVAVPKQYPSQSPGQTSAQYCPLSTICTAVLKMMIYILSKAMSIPRAGMLRAKVLPKSCSPSLYFDSFNSLKTRARRITRRNEKLPELDSPLISMILVI